MAFYFQTYIATIKAYHRISITHANEQQFTHFGNSFPILRNHQNFANCSMKLSIRYDSSIDLDSIHNKLSSDLNICFSRPFPYTDGKSLSQHKPLQIVHFVRSVTYRFFHKLYSPVDRIRKNKFERMFLTKIAST